MYGLIKKLTKENGKVIKCMVKEYLPGLMVVDTKDSINKMSKKELVNFNGLMEEHMKVSGKQGYRMELASIETKRESGEKVLGQRVKELTEVFVQVNSHNLFSYFVNYYSCFFRCLQHWSLL